MKEILILKNVVNWLMESENPSVRYRTMTELLDKPTEDSEVQDSKNQISDSVPVKTLLDSMLPEGYWLQKNPRTGEILGKDLKYGAFGTTHFVLSYLAELGLEKNNPKVAKAVERYLSLQKEDGDFYGHFSCLIGFNIRTFLVLGYKENQRVSRSIDLLLNTNRSDGGYLCDMHEGK